MESSSQNLIALHSTLKKALSTRISDIGHSKHTIGPNYECHSERSGCKSFSIDWQAPWQPAGSSKSTCHQVLSPLSQVPVEGLLGRGVVREDRIGSLPRTPSVFDSATSVLSATGSKQFTTPPSDQACPACTSNGECSGHGRLPMWNLRGATPSKVPSLYGGNAVTVMDKHVLPVAPS